MRISEISDTRGISVISEKHFSRFPVYLTCSPYPTCLHLFRLSPLFPLVPNVYVGFNGLDFNFFSRDRKSRSIRYIVRQHKEIVSSYSR